MLREWRRRRDSLRSAGVDQKGYGTLWRVRVPPHE
jgi:hypothetical protein